MLKNVLAILFGYLLFEFGNSCLEENPNYSWIQWCYFCDCDLTYYDKITNSVIEHNKNDDEDLDFDVDQDEISEDYYNENESTVRQLYVDRYQMSQLKRTFNRAFV